MKISAKAEYACLAVLALARQGPRRPPIRIREISEAHGDPRALPGADPAPAEGGRAGGQHAGGLGRLSPGPPGPAISLGEVLTAIDGPEAPPARARQRGAGRLRARPRLGDVRAAERAVLDQTTIAQLAERSSPHEWII